MIHTVLTYFDPIMTQNSWTQRQKIVILSVRWVKDRSVFSALKIKAKEEVVAREGAEAEDVVIEISNDTHN